MQGHNNWVMGVAYSPGKGELLATCSMDGTVKVWDLLNSTFIATLQVRRAECACRLGFLQVGCQSKYHTILPSSLRPPTLEPVSATSTTLPLNQLL